MASQRFWLGILHASPRGVLSHGTACAVGGLLRWEGELVDVLTPKSDDVEDLPGFFFHQTRPDYAPWVFGTRQPARLDIEHAALLAAERDNVLPRAVGRLAVRDRRDRRADPAGGADRRERAVVLTGRTVLRCSSVELRTGPWSLLHDLAAAGVPRAVIRP